MRHFPFIFAFFCVLVLGGFAYANMQGYALRGLMNTPQSAQKFANRYHK
jgi:hypothetical protein